MRRKLSSIFILFLLSSAQIVFSQAVKIEKKDEISPELRKEAIGFLRETAAEVGSLRSLESRISFSSEMASLMWFADEREARAMYQTVFNDFRQLLALYDSQAGASDETPGEAGYGAPFFVGGRNNAARKLMKALSVRQQIATSLAEHDAPLALAFFNDSAQAVGNPKIRKQIEASDAYFETRLLSQIAAQDVDTALKYGRKTLEKGFNRRLIEVLEKIYEKDADKGAAFGEDIVRKLKSETVLTDKLSSFSSLLDLGAENIEKLKGKTGKKPLFGEQSLREIADLMAQEIIGREDIENSGAARYISQIERFSPSGAARVRQKFAVANSSRVKTVSGISAPPPPPPVRVETDRDGQKQLMENVQSLGTKQLSKEEREKTIGQARKAIANFKDPNQKLFALSALALQISALGDRELAGQIMDEAGSLTNLQPKNYVDFMQIWMLSSGYAQIDPKRAFPILENTILRLNETIAAFVKVGEFIDVGGEMIEDGEIQVGGFGGGLTRELTRNLAGADATIQHLAKTDFAGTKGLTDKFDRAEVRLLAKMLVLRSLFGNKQEKREE
ncbi:MAG TPA: hypothetical protein VNI84_00620 [Pyrinomonadaceae bacterium]|nr:hypothetical protein [Pyrinomonadaceae bacterium]